MHHVVNEEVVRVTDQKTRKKGERQVAHQPPANQQQQCTNHYANQWRHRESAFILGKFVMHSVDQILCIFPPEVERAHVKKMAMHLVLYPREKDEAERECSQRCAYRE